MKANQFENLFDTLCQYYSQEYNSPVLQTYRNLAVGGWTQKDEILATNKKIRPFINRGFCVIPFFASEELTEELIQQKAEKYTTIYRKHQTN